MAMPIITQERLKELLHYDPETGIFTWIVHKSSSGVRGEAAGYKNPSGYIYIKIDHRTYLAHRLAWFYMVGEWPSDEIDHKDGDKANNKFKNIREATRSHNMQNKHVAASNNESGLLGVSRSRNRWKAAIRVAGRLRYIGTFDTPEEAHAAYVEKKRELHPFGTL